MVYVKNLPVWERIVRLGVAAAVAAYGLIELGGRWGWVAVAGGAGLALTAVFGFCPTCALAGRRLANHDRNGPRPPRP
ncbi:MAG: YgaP family membrane protein [Acidiferrobacterales bacterium]